VITIQRGRRACFGAGGFVENATLCTPDADDFMIGFQRGLRQLWGLVVPQQKFSE
jgi:hypothetical protein